METAAYELGVGTTGLLKASLGLLRKSPQTDQAFHQAMQAIAAKGEVAYRELTDHTPGFMDYFYEKVIYIYI